ncbi:MULTISPECIES: hypothetical protein [Cyanophyceae]|uniref:hypothetical protein n=1 Tax=Cyanophyceae TaxID=3028117 RepID=UPI001689EDB2|nr:MULTISPECIES: hypothetical protein [Cyanophyceae]MBD1917510.1 hypothetical protein [Phormidium sp. FACHB-77]MBD2029615.1 hypothetical protein [Phormidium sp. FACHB-322]MBD2050876.1 hypothetical protein [Leptolyngbya sp. FACHB-60]
MNSPNAPRLNQLIKTARQPQWIAALLSLGFHVVLFAAGPSFSSLSATAMGESDSDSEERRVPLIELTPEEQNRLPDFSTPAYSLDGEDDLFSLFPPSGNSLPLDPGSDFGASLAIPAPRLPSRPFPSGISPYTSPGRSSITLSPRRTPFPASPNRGTIRRPAGPPASDPASQGASTPTVTAPEDTTESSAADLELNQGNGESTNASSIPLEPTNPAAPSEGQENEQASELLARVEFNDAQTSASEVEIAKAAWLQSVQEKLGDGVTEASDPIVLKVPYSGRLCLSPEPADGLLGVVGLPGETSDSVELWTTVLKSTGYPFLNQAAEQAIQNLQQQSTDDSALAVNTSYQVTVEVEYDDQNCISREALLQSRTGASEEFNNSTAE